MRACTFRLEILIDEPSGREYMGYCLIMKRTMSRFKSCSGSGNEMGMRERNDEPGSHTR